MGIENVFVHSVVAFWRTGKTAVSWRTVDEHDGKIVLTLGNYPAEIVIHLDKAGLSELATKIGHAAIDMECVEANYMCPQCGLAQGIRIPADGDSYDVVCRDCYTRLTPGRKQ